MNIRTRKLILALFFFSGAVVPGVCGVNLGMTGAVKNKVKELDKKVRDRVATSLLVGGTAASGQAIANALVELRACDGRVQTSTTAADGSFQFNAAGYPFPLLLRVASGTTHYFSLAGAAGTANIHPFTDLVMRTYFRSARGVSDADAAYAANSAAICAPTPDTLAPMKMVVTNVVSPVLLRNTVDPDTYDLFATPFAANGAGFDRVLDETLVVAGTAFSTVTVRDTFSNVVLSTITSGLSDNAIPAAPTSLTAATVTHSSITLTWTLSVSTNVAGYAILRNGSRIAVSSSGVYADLGVSPGVQYAYTVKAFTWTGNYSVPTPVTLATALGYLTVAKTGTGTGIVSSVPAGILCGGECSSGFSVGTQVVLTAVADSGAVFFGWSGGGCTGVGTCSLTMAGTKAITAIFPATYALTIGKVGNGTVTSSPTGINCGETCSIPFLENSVITVTAAASPGYVFSGWSGDGCSGTNATCAFTMNATKVVIATFVPTYSLTVSKVGGGTITSLPVGINCGATCSALFAENTVTTLTATASAGYVFTGWSGGGCAGTSVTCPVTIDADKTVTATFAASYNLSVSKVGNGTIVSSPSGINCGAVCVAPFQGGASVTLSATPGGSELFSGWSGSGCSGRGGCVVTIDAAKSVTATFVPFAVDINISRGTILFPNKYFGWTVGGGSMTNYVAYPSGWTIGGGSVTNYVAVPPGWTVGGGSTSNYVPLPPGWTAGGGSTTNYIPLPPGWALGGGSMTNYVSVAPGWTVGGGSTSNYVAIPPGWSVGGGSTANQVAVPPGWSVGGSAVTNYVAFAPGWSVGGGAITNYVSLPPGWTVGGNSTANYVAVPPGWTVGGNSVTNYVAYPSEAITNLEIKYEDQSILGKLQVLQASGLYTQNEIADIAMAAYLNEYVW